MSRVIKGILIVEFLLAALAAPLQAEKYRGKNVTIYRKDLKPVSGKVIDEAEGEWVRLKLSSGIEVEITLNDPGTRVSVQRPNQEVFEERKARCKNPKDWYELGKWCDRPDIGLPQEGRQCFEKVIEIDPDHAEARKELGYMKKGGKWVIEEEEMLRRGFKKYGGKWISGEEYRRIMGEKKGIMKGIGRRFKESEGVPWTLAEPIESDHYLLKCNSTEQVAKRYLQVMESLFTAYSQLLGEFEPNYRDKGIIYIFRNQDEFMDFTLQGRGIGGYFSPIDRKVRTYHGSFALTGNTDMVLAHEATHQFQHRVIKNWKAVPFWLVEAMAVYFGDGTRISPKKVELNVIPRDRLQTLRDAIHGGFYVNLMKLVKIRPPFNIGPCYDHGWGILFWLLQGDNPEYKHGHKGEGKRIWERYLRHVATELEKLDVKGEAEYFRDLILKEARKPDGSPYSKIEEWEEDYKKFILALPLEPLGEWKPGSRWDGFEKIGIKFRFPGGMKKVEEKDLRQPYREAAAATTKDGLRLWLSVYMNMDQQPQKVLEAMIRGIFISVEYDGEFKFEHVKSIKVNDVLDVAVSKFQAKFRKRRESAVAQVQGGSQDGSGKKGASAEPNPGASNLPDPKKVVNVRLALFSTTDRVFLLALVGPDAPFSKMDPNFDAVLRSVRLNYEL